MRGKLHVELLPDNFPGETPAGAAMLGNLLLKVVNASFSNANKPRVVFSARGQGFYTKALGRMTVEYKEALANSGFRAFVGEDAS